MLRSVGLICTFEPIQQKENKFQLLEVLEKLNEVQSSNPGSRLIGIDVALTQSVGSDSRGHMRGIGGTISKNALKKTIPAIEKLNTMTQERDKLGHKLEGFEKTLAQLQQTVISMADTRGQPSVVNSPATPPFKSSQASSRCDLCDWKKQVLARGEVHVVDPTVEVHGAELGDGNFSVVLTEIIVAHAELWKEDGCHHTLGEVGVGGFVVWPRQFITLFP